MNKIIISIILLATIAKADTPLWSGGRESDWYKNNKNAIHHLVEVLNPQTTNSYFDGTNTIFVTNFTHTAENTNNVLSQLRFDLLDESGNNCWLWAYDPEKCGGFDIEAQWLIYEAFCFNNKKLTTGREPTESEFMDNNGYIYNTNGAWKVLDIPYVSDIKKVNERKSEYQKEKKK